MTLAERARRYLFAQDEQKFNTWTKIKDEKTKTSQNQNTQKLQLTRPFPGTASLTSLF